MLGNVVVFEGQAWKVLFCDPLGNMYVQLEPTLEKRWIDYFLVDVIDPHQDDNSLLTALGNLYSDEPDS